ncbi:tetratricopeptide repeat protein [Chitinophaga horti]|uniref:Tetratricopeptide repeat protein n=1 Tax=Chitinophaga horti TaxID=2920382 RepID=A0ABY6J8W0_9BACT|nr:tetratricopeptide repeat protein [Chitinophaga horti]UYQ94721.1 tetratricopeptide repeat protein [Chitinophaga horti]
MNNKFPIQERILKIFTPVRCVNRDQLPRYIDGKMTPIEKHLVEQHLVDCDLCYTALQSLEKQANRETYEQLTTNTITYISQHYMPAPRNVVQQKAIRKGRKQESLLAYFWTLAFIGFIGGGIYIVQAAIKHRGSRPQHMAAASPAAVPENVSQTSGDARYATITSVADNNSAPAPAQPAVAISRDTAQRKPAAAVKRDSAQLLAAATPPAKRDSAATPAPKKTVIKDSVVHHTPPPAPAAAEKKEVEKKEEPKPAAPASKEKEKEEPKAVNVDESLYKSAQMLQQQGDFDKAIDRYKQVSSSSKFGELARYQMAICYKNRGQSGKARKLFKEVVKMDGSMKVAAQNALKD